MSKLRSSVKDNDPCALFLKGKCIREYIKAGSVEGMPAPKYIYNIDDETRWENKFHISQKMARDRMRTYIGKIKKTTISIGKINACYQCKYSQSIVYVIPKEISFHLKKSLITISRDP